ncbi:MAG: T9SS type A sorting domain-containing protein, partial [Bacteroidota bacterium]
IADMSLQGGLGDITVLNTQLLAQVDEKLTAVRHANGTDIWVITTQNSMDTIQAFLLTSAGVSTTPVTSVSPIIHSGGGEIGCLKASPLKNKLALANHYNSFELHDFDNATGVATNGFEMVSSNYGAAYGVEFSPDGTRLYGSGYGPGNFIYQFDLTAGTDSAIINSATLVATTTLYATTMQIGPDHKVYTAGGWGSSFVGVINFPDLLGTACSYVDNAISLSPASCNSGLPNFFVDIFNTTGVDEMQSPNEGFAVYPNPSVSNLTVTFNSSKKSVASIELVNTLGVMILQQRMECKPGANRVELKKNTVSKGIYFLRLNNDGKIFSKKLTVN